MSLPIEGGKWETMVHLKKNTVVINPVSSKVLVNGRPVTGITTGKPTIVKDVSGQPIATLEKTTDGVVILKAPRYNLEEVRTLTIRAVLRPWSCTGICWRSSLIMTLTRTVSSRWQ